MIGESRASEEPFLFCFYGKENREMTRAELLEVIKHLTDERNWWRDEAMRLSGKFLRPAPSLSGVRA